MNGHFVYTNTTKLTIYMFAPVLITGLLTIATMRVGWLLPMPLFLIMAYHSATERYDFTANADSFVELRNRKEYKFIKYADIISADTDMKYDGRKKYGGCRYICELKIRTAQESIIFRESCESNGNGMIPQMTQLTLLADYINTKIR